MAKGNVEQFVSCMNDTSRNIEKSQKRFEYKMSFI